MSPRRHVPHLLLSFLPAATLLAVALVVPLSAGADCVPYAARLRWVQRLAEPDTVTLLAAAGDVLLDAVPGRGVRLRRGVGAAAGDWLGDVPADTVLALAAAGGDGWLADAVGLRRFPLVPDPAAELSAAAPLPAAAPDSALPAVSPAADRLAAWPGWALWLIPGADRSLLLAYRSVGTAAPVPADSLMLPGGLTALAAAGSLAVAVGSGDTSLVVLSRGTDGAPRRRGAWRGAPLLRAAPAGDRLAAVGEGTLRLFDLADPDAPRLTGARADTTAWRALAWCGLRLLAAAAGRLVVWDAGNGDPVPLGGFSLDAQRLAAGEGFTYAAAGRAVQVWAPRDGWLAAATASRPPGAGAVVAVAAAAGSLLVAAGEEAGEPVLWTALRKPDGSLAWLGAAPLTAPPRDLAAAPGVAVVLADSAHAALLTVVALPPAGVPQPAGRLWLAGEPRRVSLDGSVAVAALAARGGGTVNRLLLVDVSDPRAPALLDQAGLPYATHGLAAAADHRVWLSGEDGHQGYVEWFDIADPRHPRLLESWLLSRLYRDLQPLPGTPWLAAVGDGGALELAERTPDGFLVPRAVLWLPDDDADRLAVAGRTAVTGGAVPVVLDLADPRHPAVKAGLSTPAPAGALRPAAAGSLLAAAAGAAGLAVLPPPCGSTVVTPPPPGDGPPRRPPPGLRLDPPFPNPGNPGLAAVVHLDRPGPLRAVVVDLAGRVVRRLWDGPAAAGPLLLRWTGEDAAGRPAASGSYRLVVESSGRRIGRAVTLVR